MKQSSTSGVGALHPIVFFVLVYTISLFLAFYVCRTVYFTIYGDEATAQTLTTAAQPESTAIAYN